MNKSLKLVSETFSADDKVAGFDYQYYYFLLQLLNLKSGESIGLEVKDDVHLEKANNSLVLIQLKHTINPEVTNLTEKDLDLWKTLSNWIKIICDPKDGRLNVVDQKNFCENTTFILITNKGITYRNRLYKKVHDYQNSVITYQELKEYLILLRSKVLNEDIALYFERLLSLDQEVAQSFFNKIKIEVGYDDILGKIKLRLKEFHISDNRIDNVLSVLEGNLRRKNYINVINKKKTTISFEEFHKNYSVIFEIGRSKKLMTIRKDAKVLDPINQPFIKQLIDIKDLEEDEEETILEYTKFKLRAINNLSRWLQAGDITELELDYFDELTILIWKNVHKKVHRKAKDLIKKNGGDINLVFDDLIEMAQNCLDEIRTESLSIADQPLDIDICNGQFYSLSDNYKIGWLFDWEERY